MTTYEELQHQILDRIETILEPLKTDGVVEDVVFGVKGRRMPNLPFVQVMVGPETIDMTTIGSIGNREVWIMEVGIVAITKELDEPIDGVIGAKSILSRVRNLILSDRQLGIPDFVRKVDSVKIEPGQGYFKKKTIYGAISTFKVWYILDNQEE